MPGGVTFSGGECLLQICKFEDLLKRLQVEHIHTSIETCLFIPSSKLQIALKYIDLFYVDIKILDEEKCKEIVCGDLNLYLSNLNTLIKSDKPIIFRIPVIGGYTDDEKNRRRVVELLESMNGNVLKIELIKEHNLGESKYKSLGLDLPTYIGVSDKLMNQYKSEIEEVVDLPVEVCRI